jgi:O-antigen/teichoic acid export membrane protein
MRGLVLVPTASAVTVVVAVVALWLVEAPLPWFVAASSLGELAAAATAWAVARRELRDAGGAPAAFRWDGALARDLLRDGLPLAYVNVVVVVYGRVGFLLLEAHGGEGPAADLGAATKLVSPILLLGAAVSASVAPYATHLAMQGAFDEFRARFRQVLVRILVWLGPCVAAGVFAAPYVVRALKPEYAEAATAFRWLACGALAMLVCQISTSCLVGLGHFRAIARFATLNLVVFLAMAIPLAPRMGAEGVAIATFSMEAMNAVLQSWFVLHLVRPRA